MINLIFGTIEKDALEILVSPSRHHVTLGVNRQGKDVEAKLTANEARKLARHLDEAAAEIERAQQS